MKANFAVRTVIIFYFCFLPYSLCRAVDTGPIERVRQKDVLDEEDFVVIKRFISDAINELVNTTDFTDVARLRSIIVARQSEQAQYAEQYSKYLRQYIGEAMVRSQEITDTVRRSRVQVNLMILVSELSNPRLVDIAISALDSEDEAVRYWAVRSLSRPGLLAEFEGFSNSAVIEKISRSFEGIIEKSSPQVLRLMAEFSAVAEREEAKGLLLKIADKRIKGYSEWTAKAGQVDIDVLKLLGNKLAAGDGDKAEVGRRFAQLYSYIMQKYIMVLKEPALVTKDEKQRLTSILVEIEDKCIGRLTGLRQSVIKSAIESDNVNGLVLEHERLLGGGAGAGEIPSKYGFEYRGEGGAASSQPRELPGPPVQE